MPGQPDFKRIGKAEFRYHPESRSYTYKRGPNAPSLSFHVDGIAASRAGETSLPTTEEPVVCATSGHRIRVMYSSAASATPSATHASQIRTAIRRMNSKIVSESLQSSGGARALRMRVDCDASNQIRILGFKSSGEVDEAFEEVDDLFGAPSGASSVKNLIFYAGSDPAGVAAGYGLAASDDDKSSSDGAPFTTVNENRTHSASGIVYAGYWSQHTTLHELFHTMGAVQVTAPYATYSFPSYSPGFHCQDGFDVMCYDDKTYAGGAYSETRCPANGYFNKSIGIPLDCMYDSYFDTVEESGEYLNSHWNIGGTENPFLGQEAGPSCDPLSSSPIKIGDMTGDSKAEVFRFTNPADSIGAVNVWQYNGSTFTSLGKVGTGLGVAYQDRIGDWDGDGDDDVSQITDGGFMYGWRSNATSYTPQGQIGNGWANPCEIRMGDMNGDGKDDAFRFDDYGNGNGNGWAWLSTGTSGGYSYIGLIGTGFGANREVQVGDMDGDGDDDLFEFGDDGRGFAWRSNGSSYTYLGQFGTSFGSNKLVRVGDRDGDGDDDLFQFGDDGKGYYWRSDGTSYSYLGQFGSGFGLARGVRVADINGDAKADILSFANDGKGYAWIGSGSSFTSVGQIGSGFGAP